jgi:Asp-tRNA(Asn)/Glu-tRNA(Gln) amidotransferase B subunit
VLEKHEKAVKDFKEGDTKALNFLMGEIMKATERRADYRTAQEILKKLIA